MYTSVPNKYLSLITFVQPLAHLYFPENHDFLDIFLPSTISSASRGRAFLWLCYHYLEAPSSDDDDDYDGDASSLNPFADTALHPGKMPTFVLLTSEEAALENVDPEEEKALCDRLISHRSLIVRNQANKASFPASVNSRMSASGSIMGDDDDDAASVSTVPEVKPRGKRGGTRAQPSVAAKEKKAAGDKVRRAKLKERLREERETDMPLPHSENAMNEHHYAPEGGMCSIFSLRMILTLYVRQSTACTPTNTSIVSHQRRNTILLPLTRVLDLCRRLNQLTLAFL